MIGYYTRYGDVRELLNNVDDRYVIVELRRRDVACDLPSSRLPPAGWLRDFVVVGDGWIKDGDFNSTFSKTGAAAAVSRQGRIQRRARRA